MDTQTLVDIGLALDIAGPAIFLILIIIGAIKAWPYRKTDRDRFAAIYRPFKLTGAVIWIVASIAGILIIRFA